MTFHSCTGETIPTDLPPSPGVSILMVVAGLLIDSDNRILVAQRPQGKSMAGLWEFPGGKIDKDETPEYALIRELNEELGVLTGVDCLQPLTFASHGYDDFHMLMPVFACRRWKGTPRGIENQALKWVTTQELFGLKMPPADIPLLPLIHDML